MADLLKIQAAEKDGEIVWSWADKSMFGYKIQLDQPPQGITIKDGDVWQVSLVKRTTRPKNAIVQLVAKEQEIKSWQKIKKLPGFFMDQVDLQVALIMLHGGSDLILVGPKGTGKTTWAYKLAETLGWQEPAKIDIYTIKKVTDIFGSDAAEDGRTIFRRSMLYDYIVRAQIAYELKLDTEFIVILDEINRVHSKANEGLHGLFDDTRQVSFTTSEGTKIVKLPPNIHFVGTMNLGSEYQGTFALDDALKDRFVAIKFKPMPEDSEVKKLIDDTGILEDPARKIVRSANVLRRMAQTGVITFAPSFRLCRNTAKLVKAGVDLRTACIKVLLCWCEGEIEFDDQGRVKNPDSEAAQAYSALVSKGATSF